MGGQFGLLAAVGYAAWIIVTRAIKFFDSVTALKASVAKIEKSVGVMNHNSDRLEKAMLYAHILKPEDFPDDP